MLRAWTTQDAVRLELCEWRPDTPREEWGLPLVCVHGAIGSALSFADEGVAAAAGRIGGRPRALLGFSRRGMAGSDAPPTGYSLEDFVADLKAAVDAAEYRRFVLFGHSLGVPVAISYAAQHGNAVAGLVLGDFGPRYPAYGSDWIARIEERFRRDAADGGTAGFSLSAMRQMQREARAVALDAELNVIACPVLVVTGDQPDVLLSADDRAHFNRGVTDLRIVVIPGAGHGLDIAGDNTALLSLLGAFLVRADESA